MLEVTANKQYYSQSLILDAQDIKRQHRAMSSKSVIQNLKVCQSTPVKMQEI
jgi:hypothetical protein